MPPNPNIKRLNNQRPNTKTPTLTRVRVIYTVLIVISAVFIIRAFYLEVIKHNYYQQAAYSDQLKQYVIPAQRGMIEANSGGQVVPIVLNQTLYTLFADPPLIKNVPKYATAVQKIIGGDVNTYEQEMKTPNTQYVVLAKQLTVQQNSAITKLNLNGLGTQPGNYRVYPDGSLASQLLGFVNGSGQGQYGVEQAMNSTLAGQNGQVKAVTDAQGVPLVGNKNSILKSPVAGKNVVLTINLPLQQAVESILKTSVPADNAISGSVIVMNPNNGNIDAMANYPTYNPSDYQSVTNANLFQNQSVDDAIEPGSVMKTLTVSAGMNQGVLTPNETFDDPGSYTIDGSTITDIAQDAGVDKGTVSVTNILVDSLNTGATWMLMQMGGGQINQQARDIWHNYMVNHFHLGAATGIQQGYEDSGYVPNPNVGSALDLTYANTAFGQAVTVTPLQLAAADSAILNGGTYYIPNLVQSTINPSTGQVTNNTPKIWKKNIVTAKTGQQLAQIMEAVINDNYWFYQVTKPPAGYIIGGKTGTAQIAQPGGGYYANKFNGTFVGFIGTNKPQYVIMVYIQQPNLPENSIDTYAGAGAAAPVFGKVINVLLGGGYVTS